LSQTGLTLDAHINGAQRTLTKNHRQFIHQLQKTITDIQTTIHQLARFTSMETITLETFLAHYAQILAQVSQHETRYKQSLEIIEVHNEWVKRVGHLKRLIDYIQVIEKVTDPALLKVEIENEIARIEQALSTLGLEQYEVIYHAHSEAISRISEDIELAIKAVKLAQVNQTKNINLNEPGAKIGIEQTITFIDSKEDIWLQNLLNNDWMNLSDILDLKHSSVNEIINALIVLCKNGKVDVQIRVRYKD
jgi:hypothetical protein